MFAESLRRREGAPEWVFYEGPPTANGRPGIHHVWARSFKDLYPRFHTMRGRYVARKGGWDCHGLPVELEVEKELGFTGKAQIEEYGIEAFNRRCRESVQRYVEDWSALTTRIGMWIDTAGAYWTLSNDYIESVWWLFRRMWDRGLIYEGFKVVPYCGRCGTALSSHEVAQGYRDVTEPSVYVRFPVEGRDFDLLVWTTTPWTLISNVAVAVGPDVEYVRVRSPEPGGRDLVMAAARVAAVLGDDAEVVGPVTVDELVGLRYERPFDASLPLDDVGRRGSSPRPSSRSTTARASSTSLPRSARSTVRSPRSRACPCSTRSTRRPASTAPSRPTRGGSSRTPTPRSSRRSPRPGSSSGSSTTRTRTPTAGAATPRSSTGRSPRGSRRRRRAAPTCCARTRRSAGTRSTSSTAASATGSRTTSTGRCRAIASGALPSRSGGVASAASRRASGRSPSSRELAGRDLSDLDLHRPYVDDVTFECTGCGGRSHRVEPVLDAWFDSGSMPTAQFHYPFEHDDLFERRFPADFIAEAIDQTRGWFYSLLAVNTLVFDRTPYRNVVCLAHIVDRDGLKMSKSRGNVIDPWTILESRGADALRWYFFSAGSPWTSRRVFPEGIDESVRRFVLTLWNTYSFFVTYATLDGWEPGAGASQGDGDHVLDRWVRSRMHSTVREVTDALESFDSLRGAQALESFVDDLSNWYVRRSRARFWKAADERAHATLHECLRVATLLLAPFCPFLADEIHANLARSTESVHLADWPVADATAVDEALEAEVAAARLLVTLGRAARNEANLKVRQPLRRALVVVPDGQVLTSAIVAEVADELNVKQVEAVSDLEGLLDYTVVPNFRSLGPKVGKLMPAVKAALGAIEGATVRRALDDGGEFTLELDVGRVGGADRRRRRSARRGPPRARARAGRPVRGRARHRARRRAPPRGSRTRARPRAERPPQGARPRALRPDPRGATRRRRGRRRGARRHGEWIGGEVLAVEWSVETRDSAATAATRTGGRPSRSTARPSTCGCRWPEGLAASATPRSAAAAEQLAPLLGVVLVEELGVGTVARTERGVVAHGLAQRREERVVVERVLVLLDRQRELRRVVDDGGHRRVAPPTGGLGCPVVARGAPTRRCSAGRRARGTGRRRRPRPSAGRRTTRQLGHDAASGADGAGVAAGPSGAAIAAGAGAAGSATSWTSGRESAVVPVEVSCSSSDSMA